MPIKNITIQNIKGISAKTFVLNIIPNRPSLLVAPNGFGKSSFATAFRSLNANRLDIDEEDLHMNDENNRPTLEIGYERADGTTVTLRADDHGNTISNQF